MMTGLFDGAVKLSPSLLILGLIRHQLRAIDKRSHFCAKVPGLLGITGSQT
jgi:hypothetical protein